MKFEYQTLLLKKRIAARLSVGRYLLLALFLSGVTTATFAGEVKLSGKIPICVSEAALKRLQVIANHDDKKAFQKTLEKGSCFMPPAGQVVDEVVSISLNRIAQIKIYSDGDLYDVWTFEGGLETTESESIREKKNSDTPDVSHTEKPSSATSQAEGPSTATSDVAEVQPLAATESPMSWWAAGGWVVVILILMGGFSGWQERQWPSPTEKIKKRREGVAGVVGLVAIAAVIGFKLVARDTAEVEVDRGDGTVYIASSSKVPPRPGCLMVYGFNTDEDPKVVSAHIIGWSCPKQKPENGG